MHSTSAWCRDVAVRDVTLSMLLLPVKPEMMKFMNFITVYIHRCRVIDHTHIYIYIMMMMMMRMRMRMKMMMMMMILPVWYDVSSM